MHAFSCALINLTSLNPLFEGGFRVRVRTNRASANHFANYVFVATYESSADAYKALTEAMSVAANGTSENLLAHGFEVD